MKTITLSFFAYLVYRAAKAALTYCPFSATSACCCCC